MLIVHVCSLSLSLSLLPFLPSFDNLHQRHMRCASHGGTPHVSHPRLFQGEIISTFFCVERRTQNLYRKKNNYPTKNKANLNNKKKQRKYRKVVKKKEAKKRNENAQP